MRASIRRRQIVQATIQQHSSSSQRVGSQGFQNRYRFHGRQEYTSGNGLYSGHTIGVHRSEFQKSKEQLSHDGVFAKDRPEDVSEYSELAQQTDDTAVLGRTRLARNVRGHGDSRI